VSVEPEYDLERVARIQVVRIGDPNPGRGVGSQRNVGRGPAARGLAALLDAGARSYRLMPPPDAMNAPAASP